MSKPRVSEPKTNKLKNGQANTSKPPYKLFADELPDILDELKRIFEDPEPWLDTPNEHFMGRTPRELIDTDREIHLRDWIRRVKHGVPT